MPPPPSSILLINIESLRADHLGAYGYPRETSPNIDALASESVRFEWAFTSAPHTAPAQASLLSGLYPSAHGMISEGSRLPEGATTLAEALAEAGYTTAAFVDGGFLAGELGFDQGFGLYDNSRGKGLQTIVPKALEWIRQHAEDRFFLMVHTYDIHAPYDPPELLRGLFAESLQSPSPGFEPTTEVLEAARLAAAAGEPLATHDLEYTKALYDAEIRHVDDWIGTLLEGLRDLDLDRNAVVVLVADHGEEFQEHDTLLHDTLHSTVTRVPLVIRLPGGAQAGPMPKVVETIDLMPTLLELAGARVPDQVQGRSLIPLMEGRGTPPYIAFSESALRGGEQAVALGGWRLITNQETGAKGLFNLAEDPMELSNLAESEGERVESLELRLEDWRRMVAQSSLGEAAETDSLAEETLEQLKSLGYIQ